MIIFKEFIRFANTRACDGAWSMVDALAAIEIIKEVKKVPFWKRKKYWNEKYSDLDLSAYPKY